MQQSINRLPFDLPRYSYGDYKNWSNEWELIDGYPYSLLPSPTYKHQHCISQLLQLVGNVLEENNSSCEVYSRLDWIVSSETVVRPDLMIVCGKIETDWLMFPPTLIVEIASASTYMKDRKIKYKLYEMNKVKYYLLADTEKEKVDCYELVDGAYQSKTNTTFLLNEDCEITIDFEKIWA